VDREGQRAMTRLGALLIAAGIGLPPAAALGNPLKSLYTTVDLRVCKRITTQGVNRAWRCSGLAGMPVYVAKGRLRQFVSAGTEAQKRRAARQTLGAAYSMFAPGSARATIEWRFDRRGEKQLPYAMIVRFHTLSPDRAGDVLVVFRADARDSCHVAHIDALVNGDAIALARSIADAQARTFDCRREPIAQGAQGRSPM
jgi:hypothetical protein